MNSTIMFEQSLWLLVLVVGVAAAVAFFAILSQQIHLSWLAKSTVVF